jgi:hypothetical protein
LTLFLATLSVGLAWLDRPPTGTLALPGSLGVLRQKPAAAEDGRPERNA